MGQLRDEWSGFHSQETQTNLRRRDFLVMATAAITTIAVNPTDATERRKMYGQIAKVTAVHGKRNELIAILLEGTANLPGCLSYIVAEDAEDDDAIWVSEAWDSKQSHDASLSLPSIKGSISKGRALVAAFGNRVVTTPVGGIGLVPAKR